MAPTNNKTVLTDPTMFGTTLLLSFSGLVENVPIDAVVKVMYEYEESNASHLVVIGPNGFQMCSCLQLLRCGLPCRHTVAALVTELKRADEFKGESIHPRWRPSIQPWSIEGVGLSDFNGHERGPYSGGGGVTGDLEGIDCGEEEGTGGNNRAASVTRGRLLANLIEMASRGARTLVDNLDEKKVISSDCTICFATLKRDIDAYVKGAASVDSGGLSGIGNLPMPVTKSRRESGFEDCTEGHASKQARVGPAE